MKDHSNITPNLLETIERYYNNTMAQEERTSFEEKLTTDTNFKTLVEDIRTTLLGLETQALKEQLDTFHKDIPKAPPQLKPSSPLQLLRSVKIAIAAGIILALGLFWFYSGSSHDRVYSTYFKPDPGLPTTMSASNNFEFYDAMVNYKQGDYKLAISKWEKLEEKALENDTIAYFLGVANLADEHPETAIPYLEKTANNSQSSFAEDAMYYLGLAHLKMGEIENAKEAFTKSGSKKSKILLRELE